MGGPMSEQDRFTEQTRLEESLRRRFADEVAETSFEPLAVDDIRAAAARPARYCPPRWLVAVAAVVVLALARLGWRAGHAVPPLANSTPLATLALKLGHGALYLLMFLVPIIGFAPLFARGRGINFGLFQIASPIERTKDWIKPTTEIHEIAAWALIALAVGHVAAAIYHQAVLKDGVLLRMMPEKQA